MSVICRDVFNLIEKMAPLSLAEKWDNPGLQAGNPDSEITAAMLTLDVNINVVREAREKGAGLIVSHHPMIFRPLKSVSLNQPAGQLLECILKNDITVYTAHTNLDLAADGVSAVLASKVGLTDTVVLEPAGEERYVKLAVFIPVGHVDAVHRAISAAGAGWIGDYSHCSFQTMGTGTFQPCAGTKPFIGEVGNLSLVEEAKLETIVPESKLAAILEAMFKSHPYEEVAYDLYPLKNLGPIYGLGLTGRLDNPLSFGALVHKVKAALGLQMARAGGDFAEKVQNVAVCGGAGAKYWSKALTAGARVFITGDIGHHEARDMLDAGLNFIDAGHYGTEAVILPVLQRFLEAQCSQDGFAVKFFVSKNDCSPFVFM